MIKQLDLIQQIEHLNIRNINSSWLPSLLGTAQFSYQSDVTSINIPIPGFPTIEPPNKDQYKFFIDAGQVIYDGGTSKIQKNLASSNSKSESYRVESEFYKIKEKVIQLYFGILILQEQNKILGLSLKDLDAQLGKTKKAYEANTVSGYQWNTIQAEKIKLDQRIIETNTQLKVLLNNLSLIVGVNLSNFKEFLTPVELKNQAQLNRPEYKLFEIQKHVLDEQNKLNNTKIIPKVALFAQGGYSNPALNFLKNEFEFYYLAGLKLNWNISSIYNRQREHSISILNKNITQLQSESFIYKLNLEKIQSEEDSKKFKQLMESDLSLVQLRVKIKEASKLQYDNGILTISDYIKDLNAEEQARTNEIIHKLSFLQSIYITNNIFGN